MANLLTVLVAALPFLWPAILNRYPIVYSDTGGFLEQALMPDMGWDKPWIYGPFLTPFDAGLTLWGGAAAQAVILSAMLFLAQASLETPRRLHHLVLCAILAVGSAAPWFASLLMPDVFAPVTVLGLFVLAQARVGRAGSWMVAVVTTIAIASHLAHLVVAAACIVALCALHWRLLWRPAAPLAAALALLVASNLVGNGVAAVSPYGSVFALARLVADGPAATVIRSACPQAGWRLCDWADRLPADSDDFLWDPHGPVWAYGYGPIRIAPEAATIVRTTLLTEPGPVLLAALRNTGRQLVTAALGDALTDAHLDITVRTRLRTYFPPAELARFDASRQAANQLEAAGRVFAPLHAALLVLGTLATAALLLAPHWRVLGAVILVGLLANAFATGALSGPHDRYQARIAWLVLVPPVLAGLRRRAPAPDAAPPLPRAADGSSAG